MYLHLIAINVLKITTKRAPKFPIFIILKTISLISFKFSIILDGKDSHSFWTIEKLIFGF